MKCCRLLVPCCMLCAIGSTQTVQQFKRRKMRTVYCGCLPLAFASQYYTAQRATPLQSLDLRGVAAVGGAAAVANAPCPSIRSNRRRFKPENRRRRQQLATRPLKAQAFSWYVLVLFLVLNCCHEGLVLTLRDRAPPPLTAAATRTRAAFIAAAAARGGASFRSADAAQVCSNVGMVVADGAVECSGAIAARQIVSERWWEGGGLKHLFLAATSDFDSTKRRKTSSCP